MVRLLLRHGATRGELAQNSIVRRIMRSLARGRWAKVRRIARLTGRFAVHLKSVWDEVRHRPWHSGALACRMRSRANGMGA